MKKLLTLLLSGAMAFACLTSCGESSPSTNPAQEKTQTEFDCGKKAYDELVKAAELCKEMGDGIYEAWRFAIYDADDYSGTTLLNKFASEVNLNAADIKNAAAEYGITDSLLPYYLEEFSFAVDIVTKTYELIGTTEQLNTALTNAKGELKTMTAEFSDYSQYPTLKSFYSEVDSYATFLKSPEGTFEQLKSTIENYENKIRTLKSDLSFVFEE